MITIPNKFAEATVAREGAAGRQWLDDLPNLVGDLCTQWDLVLDGHPMHGYLGVVIPVKRNDQFCALKVSWPSEAAEHEPIALATWNGNGAVRLLESQPALSAMLLERLDSGRSLEDVNVAQAVTIAGRLLRRLAVKPPEKIPHIRDVAERFCATLPERRKRYGQSIPHRWLDAARDTAVQLGASAGALMVNYDLIYADVLAGKREPWLVVDPKVVVGDPEFGIAQLLWTRLEPLETQGGIDRHFLALSEAAEIDRELARAWTLVRCIDYWLWGLSVGLTEDPARCRRLLEWLS